MRNFDYIKELGLDDLHRFCSTAEENQISNPVFSAINARKALEYMVRAIYKIKNLEIGERQSLFELIDAEPFKEFISDEKMMMSIHYVRKVGNNGAHTSSVSKKESFFCLLNTYNIVASILIKLKILQSIAPFNKDLIPNSPQNPTPFIESNDTDKIVKLADKDSVNSPQPVAYLPLDISEEETRRLYIDLMLKESGWEILETKGLIQASKACIEIEVEGMPNNKAIGYADYVLFGSNGKPLAVIEAKKTSLSAESGKHQAELYADCLEKRYGVRPVIYYTNGFQTYIIDSLGYPSRRLYSFHTEDDLERLIQKRGRKDISDFSINQNITDRAYQEMAIKAVCEHYNKKHRKALLVMATGTGKTRVAISLVDVLKRNDWVKNVLFLADRTSLVTQAQRNFSKLLPNETICVLNETGNSKKDLDARLMFSTYQTIINYIDNDEKLFSVGRFDLIVIDEAHRSIFGKYGAIFNYFDAMLIGLTATPREEIEKSTYDIFEMEQGFPNYAYELEDAVEEKYLVNYTGFKRGSLIIKEGIKYENLSDEEKKQMERIWEYEMTINALSEGPRNIKSSEIFTYIHNIDTIDKVLQDLMENGLKVQGGERIGKTIIFAYRHEHAEKIVERFKILYPEYGSDFCVLIDNTITFSQDLIDKFEQRDSFPQIAVSVDMLDTGIDVPDILNLVFFKPVKSKIKFMQMIGRGTRLSEGIFGNKDKEEFYIFDWCGNFEYFGKHPNGKESKTVQSLTERLFGLQVDITFHLQHQKYQEDNFAKKLHDETKNILKEQVYLLSDNHISVRAKWEEVSRFKKDETCWICLTELDALTLKKDIAPLIAKNTSDENAKRFDILMLSIELSLLDDTINAHKAIEKVIVIAEKLQEIATIPQIKAKIDTIKEVCNVVSWENANLEWLEKVREDLRDLVKFLLGGNRTFVVDIEDVLSNNGEIKGVPIKVSYKQKILDFLVENRNLPVLDKIYSMEQLSIEDIKELEHILWSELGSKEDYEKLSKENNVAVFIRSIIGIDRRSAVERFYKFIVGSQLNSEQEEFLMNIISYVCSNGDITKEIVVNEAPFDEKLSAVFGLYLSPLANYIDNIHNVVYPQQEIA